MIYTNLKVIQDNIINRERPYWRVFQRDDKNMIAESTDVESINPQKSAKLLQDEIEALSGSGFVIVKLYKEPLTKGGNNTGILTYNVKIGDNEEIKGSNQGGFNNFGLISGFYKEINDLNLKIIEQKNEAAMKEIKANYEAQNKTQAVDPMIKEILNVAKAALFKSNTTQQPAPQQPAPQQQTTANSPINGINDKKEFIDLITKWHKLDPNYLQAIHAIVFFAENERDLYNSQISLLINQYKSK